MSNVAESKVSNIIKSLSSLEDDLDSLTIKIADMKKSMTNSTQSEIDKLMEKVREMATKEAEAMINKAKEKAITLFLNNTGTSDEILIRILFSIN